MKNGGIALIGAIEYHKRLYGLSTDESFSLCMGNLKAINKDLVKHYRLGVLLIIQKGLCGILERFRSESKHES